MVNLKVLHFSTSDQEGGSARSARRIHEGLRARGVNSRMLVGHKTSDDDDVATVSDGKVMAFFERWSNIVLQKTGMQYAFIPSTRRMLSHPWVRDADIIQLFNVHGGYFDPAALPKLARRRPVVWRLSDLWPVTGHCAYPGACERWKSGCGQCPDLGSYPPVGRDMTRWLWRRKARAYARCDLTIVAPSSWTYDAARNSPLFEGRRIVKIPNGIDVNVYRPVDRQEARKMLGIQEHRTCILFSAHVAFDNPRKGTDFLRDALNLLGARKDVTLLVAGRDSEKWRGVAPMDVLALGFLTNDRQLALANAAADVVVAPSVVENLPNTVIEALACARPVVAFDAGGMSDAVRHDQTGLLCSVGDKMGFAENLKRILDDPDLRLRLGQAGKKMVKQTYTIEKEVSAMMNLYAEVMAA